ncbi:MAG: hypothetical protein VX589_10335 [Myxococcota bacterium]|nr:hypothetical protein [Myxococcota bacterium]
MWTIQDLKSESDGDCHQSIFAPSWLCVSLVCLVIGCGDENTHETEMMISDVAIETATVPIDIDEPVEAPQSTDQQGVPNEVRTCGSNTDCAAQGPWRICQSERCVVEPRRRTFLLNTARIEEPTPFRSVLNDVLGQAIEDGQLNLLVHLGHSENWLIQGVLTGAMDGIPTYGQLDPRGDYVGRSNTLCQSGVCTAAFRPVAAEHAITIRIPRGGVSPLNHRCGRDALTLVNTTIEVIAYVGMGDQKFSPIVHGTVAIHGLLSVGAADDFMVDDEMNLLTKVQQEMGEHFIPRPGGWPITIYGSAREIFFDNDPGLNFIDHPSRPGPAREDESTGCR